MFSIISGQQFILAAGAAFATYYIALWIYFAKRGKPFLTASKALAAASSPLQPNDPFGIVGRPVEIAGAPLEFRWDAEDETDMEVEMVDDDDSILVKEAEKVVEKVEDILTHIASQPANPEEVASKISALVSQYKLFLNTDYFEAINAFIAQAVETRCSIRWTASDIVPLWR